jgi:hypothetical protein
MVRFFARVIYLQILSFWNQLISGFSESEFFSQFLIDLNNTDPLFELLVNLDFEFCVLDKGSKSVGESLLSN